MGKTNYINIDRITYLGNEEYGIGLGNDYLFSEDELKDNISYPKFREKLTKFTRLLKISKLKNQDIDKYIGTVIYNNPFFTYDLVSNPGFVNATLRPLIPAQEIEVKIKVEKNVRKVGRLKKLYYFCKSFLELKTRWWAQLLTKK